MLDLANKRILVTGGAGAIGTNLVKRLLEIDGTEVVVIDNLSSGSVKGLNLERIEFHHADICDDNALIKIFSKPVDVIFHLAAFFANQNSIDHPEDDLKTNILGTVKLLEWSRKINISKFIYFNTSCMYDQEKSFSEESFHFDYHTPYSISKHSAEKYALLYYSHYGVPVVSVRVFNSYGPHEYPGLYRNVIPNFIEKALKGESLTVMGDGTDTRSFTFVSDLIEGVLLLAQKDNIVGETFNIGNDIETRIIDLAETINRLTLNESTVVFIPKRDWDKSSRRKPDIKKAKTVLGYQADTDLENGLIQTIEWFKNPVQII